MGSLLFSDSDIGAELLASFKLDSEDIRLLDAKIVHDVLSQKEITASIAQGYSRRDDASFHNSHSLSHLFDLIGFDMNTHERFINVL